MLIHEGRGAGKHGRDVQGCVQHKMVVAGGRQALGELASGQHLAPLLPRCLAIEVRCVCPHLSAQRA